MAYQHPTVKLSPVMMANEIPAWTALLGEGERRCWNADTAIYCPGDFSSGLHFCLSGIFRATAFSTAGKQRTLWLMGPNSIIGEISMFSNSSVMYFMECQENGETVFFSRKKLLEKIFPKNPQISLSIMRILAIKLKMMSEDSLAFNFMPAWKRVGAFLLQRYMESKSPVSMSHARIAEFLGLHRVTVTNAIAILRNDGLVECSSKSICLKDPDGLEMCLRDHADRQ